MMAGCQSLHFVTLPDPDKLCASRLSVLSLENDTKQQQVLQCRKLLFTNVEVLASPAPDTSDEIFIVTSRNFLNSRRIQEFAKRIGAKMEEIKPVTCAVLQCCLSYTIIAKLAPKWNRAGNLLIQGQDFLLNPGKENAVSFEVTVQDEQICIALEAYTVRLPPSQLEEFGISSTVLKSFKHSQDASIPYHAIASRWNYILPSMKKGEIVSVTHKLPADSDLHSYLDIKKYWRNLYGYILPDLPEQHIIYCNIYFKMIGERLFSYPMCCVRSQPVQLLPRTDRVEVLQAFMGDLRVHLSQLCGFHVRSTSEPLYSNPELVSLLHQDQHAHLTNLTSTQPFQRPPGPPTPIYSRSSTSQTNASTAPSIHHSQFGALPSCHSCTVLPCFIQPGTSISRQFPTLSMKRTPSPSDSVAVTQPTLCVIPETQEPDEWQQITSPSTFGNRQSSLDNLEWKIASTDNKSSSFLRPTPQGNIVPTTQIFSSQSSQGQILPLFKSSIQKLTSPFPPKSLSSNHKVNSFAQHVLAGGRLGTDYHSCSPEGSFQEVKPLFVPRFKPVMVHTKQVVRNKEGENAKEKEYKTQRGSRTENPFESSSSTSTARSSFFPENFKRKHEEDTVIVTKKRICSKPAIQDVNIEKFAVNVQLGKVTSATLISWLKTKGIPVRSREKKEILMKKVQDYIATQKPEM
uniref:uncharacterized protein C18orf63 homolog n=1 Tax=Myxine glutinosa TaxID=7769 RepID=UPI00358E52DB